MARDFDAAVASDEACRDEVSKRLSAALEARGWRQVDLATKAGLRREPVSLYVRGRRLPGGDALGALARGLGVDEEDLLPGVTARREGGSRRPSETLRMEDVGGGLMDVQLRRRIPVCAALRIARILENTEADEAE